MQKISSKIIKVCRRLREQGLSHRDIAKKKCLGLGTVYSYTKDIMLTEKQYLFLKRKKVYNFNEEQRRRGGLNCPNKFRAKYNREDLINFIRLFVGREGRIPTKREVRSHRPYLRIFSSWNNAIKAAGFKSNPVKFAKRRVAKDGHKCDSFSEMIIDDWLFDHKIEHQIHIMYPNSKMSSDFVISDGIRVEFFGLEGQLKKYDQLLSDKRKLAQENLIKMIEIKPRDLFPINRLGYIFKDFK